jgi:hypothetical protein
MSLPAPTIRLAFHQTVPLETTASRLRTALQAYASGPVKELWGLTCRIVTGGTPKPSDWLMNFLDDSDQAGALGYHDFTEAGMPVANVFVKDSIKFDGGVSVTASHELAEMLVDPAINLAATLNGYSNNWFKGDDVVAYEVCLTGDTVVPLADGSRPTIEQLAAQPGDIAVTSVDCGGKVVRARGIKARQTGSSREVVRVRFTDGTCLRCTPDHGILCANGKFREARNLLSGDRVFSGDVCPSFAGTDAEDGALRHTVSFTEDSGGVGTCADHGDVSFGEDVGPDAFTELSAVALHSPLLRSIQGVVSLSTNEKVVRANTQRVVATMANRKVRGRRTPVVEFPRNAMSVAGAALVADLPISSAAESTSPFPAPITLADLRPKTLLKGRLAFVVMEPPSVNAAVAVHSSPMGGAQATSTKRAGASGNTTGSMSHAKIVHSVESDGKENVYDLTVPRLRNYAVGAGVFVHNCDPCEDQTFDLAGLPVSNLVTPQWFEYFHGVDVVQYDYLKKLTAPFSLTSGGYMPIFRGGAWTQVFGSREKAEQFAQEDRRGHRSEARGRIKADEVRPEDIVE